MLVISSVVTGIRIQKYFDVIFLQIQVGKLLPGAFISKSSIKWQEPPNDILTNSFNNNSLHLTLGEISFEDKVLIGVQLYLHPEELVYSLKIYGKKIKNSEMDMLDNTEVFEMVNAKTTSSEKNLTQTFPGLHSASENFNLTYGDHNNVYIKFAKTSNDGQILPFFDGVMATFAIKSPLSGIGLLHYTNDDQHAGYIRPFLRSFNYENNLPYYRKYLEVLRESVNITTEKNDDNLRTGKDLNVNKNTKVPTTLSTLTVIDLNNTTSANNTNKPTTMIDSNKNTTQSIPNTTTVTNIISNNTQSLQNTTITSTVNGTQTASNSRRVWISQYLIIVLLSTLFAFV